MLGRSLVTLAWLFLSAAPFAHCEKYAVLVGIAKYAEVKHLEGPPYDVQDLLYLLVKTRGFAIQNVEVLLDSEATHARILGVLKNTISKLKKNDQLVFYFSGHGTSAFQDFDASLVPIAGEIGPDSGAIVPYDASLRNPTEAIQTLIIGKRDLRPLLNTVPRGAQAFVILDSCYSENAVKSIAEFDFSTRTVDIFALLQSRGGLPKPANSRLAAPASSDSSAYPYLNIVSLAAAEKFKTAADIGWKSINAGFQTVDGKPHGALTDSLLRGMLGPGDLNHDGIMSYDELFRFVRSDMAKHAWDHHPQLLHASNFSLEQPALGIAVPPPSQPSSPATHAQSPAAPTEAPQVQPMPPPPPPPPSDPRIRVTVRDPALDILTRLQAIPNIHLVSDRHDLLLVRELAVWRLFDKSGVFLSSYPLIETGKIASQVRTQALVRELREWSAPDQSFNVKVDAEPTMATGYDRYRTEFHAGERVTFRIATEKPAYLLLLDIDKDGKVTVLFPGPNPGDQALRKASEAIQFDVAATAPAGAEQLKLIGFADRPADWGLWACSAHRCPSFTPGEASMSDLMDFLRKSRRVSEASLKIVTTD